MLDLALQEGKGSVRLADIADRQGISLSYLEQLFTGLRRSELVTSTRGPGGGYRLARRSSEISVADVIGAVHERIDATRCHGGADCQGGDTCLSHHLWMELSDRMHSFLESVTLAEVVARQTPQGLRVDPAPRGDSNRVPLTNY